MTEPNRMLTTNEVIEAVRKGGPVTRDELEAALLDLAEGLQKEQPKPTPHQSLNDVRVHYDHEPLPLHAQILGIRLW